MRHDALNSIGLASLSPHRERGFNLQAGKPRSQTDYPLRSKPENAVYSIVVVIAIGLRDSRDCTAKGIHIGDLGNP